jgi:two-component sensor histidine kinase
MSRRFGPAEAVLALTLLLVVTIFAIFGVLVWQGFGTTVRQAEGKTQSAADVVAEETQWLVGSSLLTLRRVDFTLQGNPANLTPANKAALDEAVKSLPAPLALAIYDAAGHEAMPGQAPGLPADIADDPTFRAVAAGQDWQISPQMAGADGKPIFVVAKRLATAAGFTGVAMIAVGAEVLANFWGPLDMGQDSTISLVRSDGWIIARYPSLKQGLNLAKLPVFADLQAGPSGSYLSASSPADGVARVVSFRHLPTLGIIAIASVSQAATIGALWTAVYTVLLLMLPIAAALIAGSIWTSRLLNESYRTRNALESALAQNQVLFREIHHRVKNNLQSVSSLLQLQPIAPEIKVEMGRRIAAMSAVHEHIYRSDKFSIVAVKAYLQTLITNLRESYNSDAEIDIRLEDLSIDKDGAMPLGLIVNEVVSNTFKHAFVDGRKGVITVTLERTDGNNGRLVIADNGVGFDPGQRAKGMGRRLIVGLTEQLQGESSFVSEGGSRFTLTFPLARAEQVS